jgi:hypothetical protein
VRVFKASTLHLGRYASTNTNVLRFSQQGTCADLLTEVLRDDVLAKPYVYFRVDGIHVQARLDDPMELSDSVSVRRLTRKASKLLRER